jgi:hypothetical protein
MKLDTVFLREGCILPDRLELLQEPFSKGWAEAVGIEAAELDAGIRGAGWHLMWIADSHSFWGIGRTPEAAIHRALVRALGKVEARFNAAELAWFQMRGRLGFQIANVTLHARQIQRDVSLDSAEDIRLGQVPAL